MEEMMSKNTTIQRYFQNIKAPISQIYSAFTNATLLREWFCNVATVNPIPGGRFYVSWNNNYYVSGDYISLEKDICIEFNWRGKDDPDKTTVKVKLSYSENETHVEIEHRGIGTSQEWEKTSHEIAKGWQTGLENLKSTFETGEDLRIVHRPMLGILIDNVDEQGIKLGNVIEGMSAHDAGLCNGDVIKKFDGVVTTEYGLLTDALNKHKAGDTIEIEYIHESTLKTSKLKLSGRRIPPIPWVPSEFAKEMEKRNKEVEDKLDEFVKNISDTEAAYKPDKDQWSILEIIAHLLQGQRYIHQYFSNIIVLQEPVSDDFGGNLDAAVISTTRVYPSLKEIIAEFKRCNAEIVAFITEFPAEFVARKSSYWRVAFSLLEAPYHFYGHVEQMNTALSKAKEA
jgi:uncharacterized protein YndB with AHSA1/START domain